MILGILYVVCLINNCNYIACFTSGVFDANTLSCRQTVEIFWRQKKYVWTPLTTSSTKQQAKANGRYQLSRHRPEAMPLLAALK